MTTDKSRVRWEGVFPALTTKFAPDGSLDIPAMERHMTWQMSCGVHGLVVLGSLGENGSLEQDEKNAIVRLASSLASGRLPVLAGIAEPSTTRARRAAADAAREGATGLMVLPPMRYASDRRETLAHIRAVAAETDLPVMLYNNPVAYRIDITPEMFADLADEPKFVALKESSDDPRRITDIKNLLGDRYVIFAGVDDLALESLVLGASGWVAGLVCAFPQETVALFRLIRSGRLDEAVTLYRWFMPLLHLDVAIKFVQYIKLTEAIAGVGTEHVRPPRLPLEGDERHRVERIVREALASRPRVSDIEPKGR